MTREEEEEVEEEEEEEEGEIEAIIKLIDGNSNGSMRKM